jgi:hypothetical protein
MRFANSGDGGHTMTDNDTPNRAANKDKAEGERWKSEQGAVPNSARSPDRRYDTPRRYEQPVEESESLSHKPQRAR